MPRPSTNSLDIPWGPQTACPCGSQRSYASCCAGSSGFPLQKVGRLLPPGVRTGFRNSGCYLGHTRDCSRKISKEHYISKSIIQQLSDIKISGLPWVKHGEPASFGVNSMTASVLCTRHNNALSPLDTHAGRFFKTLFDAQDHAANGKNDETRFFLHSGDALEKWIVKSSLGLYASGILSVDGRPAKNHMTFDSKTLTNALFSGTLNAPLGLRFNIETEGVIGANIGFAPLYSPLSSDLAGAFVVINGIRFNCIFDATHAQNVMNEKNIFRPWVIDINGPTATSRIILTWSNQVGPLNRVSFEIESYVAEEHAHLSATSPPSTPPTA